MSGSKGKASTADGAEAATPSPARASPARDALRGNLDTGHDSASTLKKKKSWMASLRDAVSKSALSAKAAVDTIRGGNRAVDQNTSPGAEGAVKDEEPRQSIESRASKASTISSSTPLQPHQEHRNTLMSKVTTSSLRQHLHHSKKHNKRGSVYSVATRPSTEITDGRVDPENFTTPPQQQAGPETHKRHTSKASSIVGSIRGFRHKTPAVRPATPTKKEAPERPADTVPVPSSPIDIPVAAPALELDLGPTGFGMSSAAFGRSPEHKPPVGHSLNLMNPAAPRTNSLPISRDTQAPFSSGWPARPVTPKDLLNPPQEDLGPTPPSPMPGTNFNLEVDGANSEKSERSQVFERSVTPPNEKERKELRTMRSLDAMAEACTIAHASDEVAEATKDSENPGMKVEAPAPESPKAYPAATLHVVQTPRRNVASAETVHTVPTDMPELERQEFVHRGHSPSIVAPKRESAERLNDDPFSDSHAVNSTVVSPNSSLPSPTKSVTLPYRPKPSQGPAVTIKFDEHPVEEAMPAGVRSSNTVRPSSPGSQNDSLIVRNDANQEDAAQSKQQYTSRESSEEDEVWHETLASDDDPQIRAHQLHSSEIVHPVGYSFSSPNQDSANGMSPQGGPLVPQIFNRISTSQNSSPRSTRSRTTFTAGLGDAEYKFSFENWLRDSSNASAPPDEEPVTPSRRRRMDLSIDSVSTNEERKTPQVSPSSTSPSRTPSMGNRLEFDLKRSERSSRYNALQQEITDKNLQKERRSSPNPARPHFIVGGSEDTETPAAFQLADFESRGGTPQKTTKPLQERVASEDSVADSLKDAAYDYHQLEERLGEPVDVFADPEGSFADDDGGAEVEAFTRSGTPSPVKKPKGWLALSSANRVVMDDISCIAMDDSESKLGHQVPSAPEPDDNQLSVPTAPDTPAGPPSAASSTAFMASGPENRIASPDTLDESLQLYSSPESGYKADKSSMGPDSSSNSRCIPSRYRSRRKGKSGPLSEISRNGV